MNTSSTARRPFWGWIAALLVAVACPLGTAEGATINIRSLESLLATPTDYEANTYGLWSGWATQRYEYNMPFIELQTEEFDQPISAFRMTIGDTNFVFSNEYDHKNMTNSFDIPANGEYALLGKSTPGIGFDTRVENNGTELVVEFDQPLGPEQVVRFQVDIDRAPGVTSVSRYAPYTEVFFKVNGGDDTSGNSMITLELVDGPDLGPTTLPNYEITPDSLVGLTSPRSYSTMQMPPDFPDGTGGRTRLTPNGEIPEPTALLLALSACLACGARKSGRA